MDYKNASLYYMCTCVCVYVCFEFVNYFKKTLTDK